MLTPRVSYAIGNGGASGYIVLCLLNLHMSTSLNNCLIFACNWSIVWVYPTHWQWLATSPQFGSVSTCSTIMCSRPHIWCGIGSLPPNTIVVPLSMKPTNPQTTLGSWPRRWHGVGGLLTRETVFSTFGSPTKQESTVAFNNLVNNT